MGLPTPSAVPDDVNWTPMRSSYTKKKTSVVISLSNIDNDNIVKNNTIDAGSSHIVSTGGEVVHSPSNNVAVDISALFQEPELLDSEESMIECLSIQLEVYDVKKHHEAMRNEARWFYSHTYTFYQRQSIQSLVVLKYLHYLNIFSHIKN